MDVLPDEATILKLDKDSLYSLFKELDPRTVVNLCNSSKQLRELCRRYNFWVFASGEFEKMSGDTLFLIMKNLIPQEVVQFCSSNPGFVRICNRGNFWANVLKLHYGITNAENPRQTYLEKTYMHFSLQYDDFKARRVEDSLGHIITVMEKYEESAYLIVQDNINFDKAVDVAVRATDFNRSSVWIGVVGEERGVFSKAYRSEDDAILDFVESWGRKEFTNLLEFASDRASEDIDNETREYPQEQAEEIMREVINAVYQEKLLNSDRHLVYFVSQEILDELFKMGYPRFQDGDTISQARKKLFDYIKINKFFCWNIDFSKENGDLYKLKGFQVFEVKLVKSPPKWYTDFENLK